MRAVSILRDDRMMSRMVRDETSGAVVARRGRVALDPWTRARGMIARRFDGFDAMIFPGCRSIHTWFMSQALDVLFLDGEGRVVGMELGLRPWRMLSGPSRARTVIELPPGTLRGMLVRLDDKLTWSA